MRRLTQRDLADRLGIDRSTVSKALKGDPAVSAATRERVRALAAEMGFRPDPMLGALAAYRARNRPEAFHAAIAWLHRDRGEVDMRAFPGYADYRLGAEARARDLGYSLDPIDLDEHAPGGLVRLLRARGIRALVLAPQPVHGTRLDLDMTDLCGVAIGYSVESPALDLVTNDHFSTMTDLAEILRSRGCRHIGCHLWHTDNERMGRRARSAFLATSRETGVQVRVYRRHDADALCRWVRRGRFDAVIGRGPRAREELERAGFRIPDDLAYAGYALEADEPRISGMHHNNRRIGESAVEWVARKFESGDFGLPRPPRRMLIPGEWLEGATAPSRTDTFLPSSAVEGRGDPLTP